VITATAPRSRPAPDGRRHGVIPYTARAAARAGVRRGSLARLAALCVGCFDGGVTSRDEVSRVVSASREIAAGPREIFELIADPTQQPRWDGNDNLTQAPAGQRIRRTGDVFLMTTTKGNVRENHVVEFEEGRRVAWTPSEPGQSPPGHLWRWDLQPIDAARTLVTHTYDWTQLTDEKRFPRARATTADKLRASLDRLAALVEGSDQPAT
jgi:uncharacterized protein YndB with AHSA1/START domain